MIVWNVSREELVELAEQLDLHASIRDAARGRALNATLLHQGGRFSTGSRVACIHGYAAMIEAVLRHNRDAVVKTKITTYMGLDDFHRRQADALAEAAQHYMRHDSQRCECDAHTVAEALAEMSLGGERKS